MPAQTLDHRQLEEFLPHRGVNLLLDRLTLSEDGLVAVSHTRVAANDPRGRDLFFRRAGDGRRVWLEPFLGELTALTGAPLLHAKRQSGRYVAVFSSASHVAFSAEAALDDELVGEVRILRDRALFTQFSASLTCHGRNVYRAEIIAAVARLTDLTGQKIQPPDWDEFDTLQADFGFKAACMRAIDGVRRWDPESGRLVACYRYPEDHPLVPGHFPGAPVMMGMVQWMVVADAGWEARARLGHGGAVRVDGRILRPDGGRVLEVRGLVLESEGGAARFAATNRLAFREPVRPGDGVLVDVTVKPLSAESRSGRP